MFLTNHLRFMKKPKLDSVIVHVNVVTEFELCFSPCRNNKDQERHRLCCQSLLIVSFSEPCSFVVVCFTIEVMCFVIYPFLKMCNALVNLNW